MKEPVDGVNFPNTREEAERLIEKYGEEGKKKFDYGVVEEGEKK